MTQRAVVVLSVLALAACAGPVEQEPGWVTLSTPSADTAPPTSARGRQSLGSPFVLHADSVAPPMMERAGHDDVSVGGAWLLLSSDACDVFLESLEVELTQPTDAAPTFHATTGRARGVVSASSPSAARVTFPVALRSTAGVSEAELTIDAADIGDRVRLRVTVSAKALGDAPLGFTMVGVFSDSADEIPARRWDCPY